jgi:thiol-disulfide isomerase/thioredoxin
MMTTLVLVLAFVAVGLLIYKLWKPMLQAPKVEVKPNQANLYFFYTNWCGFSQKAMPEWEKLEEKLETDGYFGKTRVNPIAVDCEADQKKCTLYGIDGYPTVILETRSGLTDYTKRVTTSGLLDFLRQTLGQERSRL